jgi:hypothetical protein
MTISAEDSRAYLSNIFGSERDVLPLRTYHPKDITKHLRIPSARISYLVEIGLAERTVCDCGRKHCLALTRLEVMKVYIVDRLMNVGINTTSIKDHVDRWARHIDSLIHETPPSSSTKAKVSIVAFGLDDEETILLGFNRALVEKALRAFPKYAPAGYKKEVQSDSKNDDR